MSARFRRMRPDDREPLLDLLEHAFGERSLFSAYMDFVPDFRPDDFLLACDENDRPVSCVQVFGMKIRLAGTEVPLGGIGSVATHERHRGRGLASTLLRKADDEMRARHLPLALLYTSRWTFYGPLGWQPFGLPFFRFTRPPNGIADPAPILRSYRDDDLPAVRELYDGYTADMSGPSVRDATYWKGQLRYAGTPDEDFRVAERDGCLIAYVRSAAWEQEEAPIVLEYARAPQAADALASLLVASAPRRGTLAVPAAPDPELRAALRARGIELDEGTSPFPMWLLLDPEALLPLVEPGTREEDLLAALVGRPDLVCWPSDRF